MPDQGFIANNQKIKLSIIVPIHNEEANIKILHQEICDSCTKLNEIYEIIFINDGSIDNSLQEIKKLTPVKIINFRKNFGQTAALDAGIKAARGEFIITMDGDLQNDSEDIIKLLEKLRQGYDVVSGWRKKRRDPFLKKIISRVANMLRRFFIDDGIHDSGCSLKIYKKECFDSVDLYGEMHRFIPAILKLKGFKIGEVQVNHRPRIHGKTKYTWKRTIKGLLDMISVWFWKKYANRPLHLFGSLGLLLVLTSLVAGIVAIYHKIINGLDLSDTVLTELAMFGFITGFQFVIFGLLADILSKTYYSNSKDKTYIIKDVIEL